MEWWKSRRLINWLGLVGLLWMVFAALRWVFLVYFSELWGSEAVTTAQLVKSFQIGLAFDFRLALLIALPTLILSLLPKFNTVRYPAMRWASRLWLMVAMASVMTLYFLDFGHYNYLGVRVNANVGRFFSDASISGTMMWQSYPIVKIVLAWLAVCGFVLRMAYRWENRQLNRSAANISRWSVAAATSVGFVVFVFGFLGRVDNINWENPVPLRWNDAFYDRYQALGEFGLNPVLFFIDTLRVHTLEYDVDEVAAAYPVMARYLGLSQAQTFDDGFDRSMKPAGIQTGDQRRPNVVFVMLESLGASRVSAYGNPIPTTPNLDAMFKEGWWLRNFYVPVTGTAKTVWASITGIPDVTRKDGATRNPYIARQHTLVNAMDDYEKLYMIGGSAGWANMSALIRQSIDDVQLYDEGHWQSNVVDVWGISDLDLFRESDPILQAANERGPFFAYIQTAGNHRPFTIPKENGDFQPMDVAEEEFSKYGFRSLAQLNGVHLLDYNIGEFMKMAKAGGYFDNTIFVFFGDHNNRITQLPHMPPLFEQMGLESNHVPALIYAPKLIGAKTVDDAVGLADLLPTVLTMTGHEYTNRTLGRAIQDEYPEAERTVPLVLVEGSFPIIGAVTENFLVRMNHDGTNATLHKIDSEDPQKNYAEQYPTLFQELYEIGHGAYETARMMLESNVVEGAAG